MPTLQITVDGVDVTADVVFETARFKSLVNGNPGEAFMRVRDLDSTYDFTEGSDWLLAVDGEAVWRGFVTQVKRAYIFPAGDVSESGLQRFWDLTGADLNILFTRRVVFDTATPTNVEGTQFAAGTADTVAITELLDNWLDLSSDDLDTTTGVVGVGDIDPAQKTRAWSGGWYWGAAMGSIAMIPAAIYYLRPEMGSPRGTLVYCDVDVPDAPFGLSDQPNGTTTKGFREMEIILDGTSLANDVLAIGMGYGKQVPVVKRLQSTTSQASHGLWQQGLQKPGVYKQATIDRIADSVLNGSPESKRGAKSDRPAVQLVTYEPGLLAGYKVDFTSEVWGWTDVIPVRQMEVTFESPTAPRYELLLSHEIDSPWSFIDQFWPKMPIPEVCPDPPCFVWPPPPPPACDCGITDAFDRADGSLNGSVSTSGRVWGVLGGGAVITSEKAVISGLVTNIGLPGFELEPGVAYRVSFLFTVADLTTANDHHFGIETPRNVDSMTASMYLNFNSSRGTGSPAASTIEVTRQPTSGSPITDQATVAWTAGATYAIDYYSDTYITRATVTGPGANVVVQADLTGTPQVGESAFIADYESRLSGSTQVGTLSLWLLDVPGNTRCDSVQYDDFERTEASGWGNATPSGYAWTTTLTGSSVASVDGTTGHLWRVGDTASAEAYADVPVRLSDGFDAYILFQIGDVSMLFTGISFRIFTSTLGDSYVELRIGAIGLGDDMRLTTDGVSFQFEPYPAFTDDSVWWMRLHYDDTIAAARFWELGASEPSTWDIQISSSGDTRGSGQHHLTIKNGWQAFVGASLPLYFESIDFDYPGKPCYYDGTTPVDPSNLPVSVNGYGCEEPARTSSTVYTTTATYQPKTTFVWRDGLFQRRGTDYTEDSGNQTITFSDAVASTSVIRMCYFAEVTGT